MYNLLLRNEKHRCAYHILLLQREGGGCGGGGLPFYSFDIVIELVLTILMVFCEQNKLPKYCQYLLTLTNYCSINISILQLANIYSFINFNYSLHNYSFVSK